MRNLSAPPPVAFALGSRRIIPLLDSCCEEFFATMSRPGMPATAFAVRQPVHSRLRQFRTGCRVTACASELRTHSGLLLPAYSQSNRKERHPYQSALVNSVMSWFCTRFFPARLLILAGYSFPPSPRIVCATIRGSNGQVICMMVFHSIVSYLNGLAPSCLVTPCLFMGIKTAFGYGGML